MMRSTLAHPNRLGILWLIPPLYTLALWRCNYGDTFGERDSYRVFVGIADAISRNDAFRGPLMYGQDASPGYYVFLGALARIFEIDIHHLAGTLNAIGLVCSLLSLVPLFIVAKAVAGRAAALSAVVIIYAVPVWWSVSEYAHPEWPAILFFLVALAFAASRARFSALGRYLCDAAVALALAVSFTMRLDAVLMAPMMLAFCIEKGRFSFIAALRLLACGLAALIAFVAVAALNSDPVHGPQSQSVWQLFASYHALGRFVSEFKGAQFSFAAAVNPFLLTAFAASVAYMIAKRNMRVFFLSVPTVALNYLFWIPNANPRHYLYLVPALVFAVAWVAGDLMERGAISRKINGFHVTLLIFALGIITTLSPVINARIVFLADAMLAGVFIVATWQALRVSVPRLSTAVTAGLIAMAGLASLVCATQPTRLTFKNQFPPGMGQRYARLAVPLLALPPLGKTILVIADAYPIIATMQLSASRPLTVAPAAGWSWPALIHVTTEQNDFEFFIQEWEQQAAVEAAKRLSAHGKIDLLVDDSAAPDITAFLSGQPNIQSLRWP